MADCMDSLQFGGTGTCNGHLYECVRARQMLRYGRQLPHAGHSSRLVHSQVRYCQRPQRRTESLAQYKTGFRIPSAAQETPKRVRVCLNGASTGTVTAARDLTAVHAHRHRRRPYGQARTATEHPYIRAHHVRPEQVPSYQLAQAAVRPTRPRSVLDPLPRPPVVASPLSHAAAHNHKTHARTHKIMVTHEQPHS